jgi:hypothetical protein
MSWCLVVLITENRIVLLDKNGKGFFQFFFFLFSGCKQTPCQARLARDLLGAGTMPVVKR